ncbi:MAG: hypothetical protein RLZZ196_1005 [Bacteroidota bacterium]|jgi:hypothetical protein
MSEENNEQDFSFNENTQPTEPVIQNEEPVVEQTAVEQVAEELNVTATISAPEEPKPAENIITAPSFGGNSDVPGMGLVAEGVIGSTSVTPKKQEEKSNKKKVKEETVAIFSTRNVSWPEVGKVYRGYNIVSKSAADKWLTRDHIRIATPEEVAREFGR